MWDSKPSPAYRHRVQESEVCGIGEKTSGPECDESPCGGIRLGAQNSRYQSDRQDHHGSDTDQPKFREDLKRHAVGVEGGIAVRGKVSRLLEHPRKSPRAKAGQRMRSPSANDCRPHRSAEAEV